MTDFTAPAVSQLADQDIRRQALHPAQSFIVQAPAGSGKTELLTQRYLRLLTTVAQPEQILAITFTRKAANEMRNRILHSLARARGTPRPDKDHEAQNWQLAQAALQADEQHGWQLQAHPARLRIQTIDALNASLARRLPLLARMGAHMAITADQGALYEAVCARLLQQLGDGSVDSAHLETVLMHLANRVPDFVQMLCDLLARRDHWLPLLISHRHDADLRDSIEATLRAAITHHLQRLVMTLPDELHAELIELAAYGAGQRLNATVKEAQRPYLSACAALHRLPDSTHETLAAWRGIALVLCRQEGGFYTSLTKTQGFPTENKPMKQRMLALLNTLREIPGLDKLLDDLHALPTARFTDAQWQVLQALLQLLPKAVSELMLDFQASGQVDYVELALRALQAMGTPEQPTDTALAFDARLQHILVDEFQDTSITQMSLLHLLTAGWSDGDGRTLFCVGDPMQSIYRFRQAEVGLFLQTQQHGLPNVAMQALQLTTNFRSTQPIVAWVNATFPQLMPRGDDAEVGAVHYRPSVPQPAATQLGRVKLHAALARTAQQEARQITAVVQHALRADAHQHQSPRIAILVSGRSHVGAIAHELKQAGIAFNAVDIERLQARSLVQDLIALTRALVHLADRTAWLACLRAPWCGLSLADLHAVAAGDAQATIYSLLQATLLDADRLCAVSDTGQSRLHRFTATMTAALAQRGRQALHDWVKTTWLALLGPACLQSDSDLQDAEAYFARLDELAEAGDLADVTRLETQLGSLFANVGSSSAARVEIMTIHKSKGLEFDVVILPSLHRQGGRDNTRLLRWTRLTGIDAAGLVLAPPGAKGDDSDAIYQWLTQLEKQRARYESGRLLYVAATRARCELHLFASVGVNKAGDAPSAPRNGTLLHLLWPQVQAEFAAALNERSLPDETTPTSVVHSVRRLPLTWLAPLPQAAIVGVSGNALLNADKQPEFNWAGETSRHVGTVVHAELERLAKLPTLQLALESDAPRRATLLMRLAELGVPEALRPAAVVRVMQAIDNTLNSVTGRWILGIGEHHQDAAAEIALSGVINNTVVNGVIDRSFVAVDGTRWIIDFKTSTHEGGGRELFLQSEVQRYRLQMQRYAALMQAWKPAQHIKTALYFPLLGEWREL